MILWRNPEFMPYYRENDDRIHVFRRRWLGPARAFGYTSFCGEHRFPVEGKHFEIKEVSEGEITCQSCLKMANPEKRISLDDELGVSQGHFIGFSRGREGEVIDARVVCDGNEFEEIVGGIEKFEGNLTEQEESVCDYCWSEYKQDQWSGRDEGGMIRVVAEADGKEKTFHAESIEAGPVESVDTGFWLHSKDGLVKKLREDQILTIDIVPTRQIDY